MRPSLQCSRNKPPPARSASSNPSRLRGQLSNAGENVVMGLNSALVQSDSSKVSGDTSSGPGSGMEDEHSFPAYGMLAATPKDVSECLTGWLTYLQMLNGLCGAGSRLSQSLATLVQDRPAAACHSLATQCHSAWEELVKATTVATSAVRGQVVAALQDVSAAASDLDTETQLRLHDNNQQVLCGCLMTFINLHYQFCAACCDYLGSMPTSCCHVSETSGQRHDAECNVGKLQQCFSRLYTPSPHGPPRPPSRSPSHLTLCSLQSTQRRWSEAAAVDPATGETNADGSLRRWSMPWDTSRPMEAGGGIAPSVKLAVPSPSAHDRSRSITPESGWHSSLASQDELQDVIQLLSCRPTFTQSTQLYHPGPSQHLPGVTLTACPYNDPQGDCGGWGDNGGAESGGPSRRGSNSPCSHRGSWQAPDMYTLDADVLASRKSSSSTDSSSSYSLHARSSTGSEGSAEIRAHLYSMWGGSDLTFNKVPESSEPPEVPSPCAANPQQRFPQAESNQTFYSDSK